MRCCWKISRIEHRVRAPWHPRAVGIRVVFFCILSCDVHPGSSSRDRDASSCCFFFFFFSFFISPSRTLALVRGFSPPPFFGDGKWPRVAKSAESVFFFFFFSPCSPRSSHPLQKAHWPSSHPGKPPWCITSSSFIVRGRKGYQGGKKAWEKPFQKELLICNQGACCNSICTLITYAPNHQDLI